MSYAIANIVVGAEMPETLRSFIDEINLDSSTHLLDV